MVAISLSDDTTTPLREKKRCVEKINRLLAEI
jgi:hypothetical protein